MKKINISFMLVLLGSCINSMHGSNSVDVELSSLTQLQKNQKLTYYAGRGDLAQVQGLLSVGADVNTPNPRFALQHSGMTSLMLAADQGRLDIVQCLLQEKSLKLDAVDSDGYTALMIAIEGATIGYGKEIDSNRSEAAVAILKAGASTSLKNNKGDTALILSARHQKLAVAEELLRLGADANGRDSHGQTALMLAIDTHVDPKVIDTLLAGGTDVNAQDFHGGTALMKAALMQAARLAAFFSMKDNMPIRKSIRPLKKMLRAGADVTVANMVGSTALQLSSDPKGQKLIRAYSPLPDVVSAQSFDREPELKDYLNKFLPESGELSLEAEMLRVKNEALDFDSDSESQYEKLKKAHQNLHEDLGAYWYPRVKKAHLAFIKDKNPNALADLVLDFAAKKPVLLETIIIPIFSSRDVFITLLNELAIKINGVAKKETLEGVIISQAYKAFLFENQADWLLGLIERFWTRNDQLTEAERVTRLKSVYDDQFPQDIGFLPFLERLETVQRGGTDVQSKILKRIAMTVTAKRSSKL